jgi:hypothetical protein
MPQRVRPGKAFQIYFDETMWEQLKSVADANCRDVSIEVRKAVERYLEAPEVIQPQAPASEPTKRPRGRPRKAEQAERDAALDAGDRATEANDLIPTAALPRVLNAEANATDLEPGAGKPKPRRQT